MEVLLGEHINQSLVCLYEGSQTLSIPEFQEFALQLIKPLLRFNSALWASGAMTPTGVQLHTAHLHNQSPDVLPAYREVMGQDRAVELLRRQGGGTLSFNAGELFGTSELSGIRGYTRRFEHENTALASSADREAKLVHWISMYRADAADEFSSAETAQIALVAPHLFKSLELNRRAQLTRLTSDAAVGDRCSAISDWKGLLHYRDARFAELLQRENGIYQAGCLSAAVVGELRTSGRYRGDEVTIQARCQGDFLFLTCRPHARADDLSGREVQIVQEISRGKSHKQIARTLELSPATVRTHIQRIHRKLSTRNTAELIAAYELAA